MIQCPLTETVIRRFDLEAFPQLGIHNTDISSIEYTDISLHPYFGVRPRAPSSPFILIYPILKKYLISGTASALIQANTFWRIS